MFTYAESVATRNTVISSIRHTIESAYNRPTMRIKFKEDSPRSYTTGDSIEGEVIVHASSDTRFDEISIIFEGTSRTWLEKFGASPAASGCSTVTYTVSSNSCGAGANKKVPFLTKVQFLKLVQPVDESTLPIPRIAAAGNTMSFPFHFVIPEQLLPSACNHPTENSTVSAAHLHVPPSLGDQSGEPSKDDMSPDMVQISYAVRARLNQRRETDNTTVGIVSTSAKVHVAPAFEDAPPAHIEDKSADYTMRKERDLRKGLLGKKMGRITVSAEQPKPLHHSSKIPATTTVPVNLTFIPVNPTTPPPSLGSMTTKLRTSTFFSTTRVRYIPTASRAQRDVEVGNYSESALLSSRCLSNTQWVKETPAGALKPTYRASLTIPITEPKCKTLVPSFSSCFATRSYRLDLALSVHNNTLTLKQPLQVSQPSKRHDPVLGSEGIEVFFTPRSVAPPPALEEVEEVEEAQAGVQAPRPPPGYSVYGVAVTSVPVRIPEPVGISPGCG